MTGEDIIDFSKSEGKIRFDKPINELLRIKQLSHIHQISFPLINSLNPHIKRHTEMWL